MKNIVVIVDMLLRYNQPYIRYAIRKIRSNIGLIDSIQYLNKQDNDLFFHLEEIIQRYTNIIIITKESFTLLGKILSTLNEDILVAHKGVLIPSKFSKYEKGSCLISSNKKNINLLQIGDFSQMPNILIPFPKKSVEFYLIDADSDRYNEQLKNIIKIYNLNLVISPIINGVSFVQVHGFKHDQWDGFISAIKLGFVEKVLFGNELSKIVVDKLIESNESITCSESCSGGLLASELVKHSGVSSIFRGSVVTYANEIKSLLVNVSSETLEKYGAVSQEVVLEMLNGSISLMDSDFALAISGVAGPTGGTIEKPIGTVVVGAKSMKGETIIKKLHLFGDRRYIQEQAVLWALKLLILTRKDTFF